jgi:hypothetical protein
MLDESMRRSLFAACILSAFITSAQAIECQTSARSSDSHWAWRLIDGRKCWYKGETGMDKSLLHWPADDESAGKLAATPDKPKGHNVPPRPEAQSLAPEILQTLPIMPPLPTFEDRWRLL